MRLIKGLFYLILVLVVVLVAGAFFLPNHVSLQRSIVIDRPASMIYPILDGYARFNEWSPWAAKDPATRYTYEGPAHGVGAKMSWVSENPDVGEGSQTIIALAPNQRVDTQLDFGPMGTPKAHLLLEPADAGATRVTWGFDSDLPLNFDANFHWNLMGRWMGLFLPGMLTPDYDNGLNKLKALMEGMPKADIAGLQADAREVSASPAYLIRGLSAAVDGEDSARVLGEAYGEIAAFASENALTLAGSPFTVVTGHANGQWQFDAGVPVDRNDVEASGRLVATTTYAGKVVDFRHVGSYDTLADTHAKAHAWLAVHALKETSNRIEIYESDPATTPADALVTVIRVPVQ